MELTLTEKSVSQNNNTSDVDYTLKFKCGSNNRFDGVLNCELKLNNTVVKKGEWKRLFDYKTTFTLLSGTATVEHNADGSLNMPIAVSVDTAESNPYSPSDRTIEWNWDLTTIPRASSITSAAAVTLGNKCSVKWTPNSADFRYKLKFSIGSWAKTTSIIHPNKTSAYTYAGYTLPLEIAQQITESRKSKVTVTLTTFSDSEGKTAIGSDTETFDVTVPDSADTQPEVEMSLTPVSPLPGLYLQGLSKVQATLNAVPKLGTKIENYSIGVDGVEYQSPYLSNALTKVGTVDVEGYATDARGITGSVKQAINVLPYYRPKLTADAYRCTSDGVKNDSGEYLIIKATRDYAPVVAEDGKQYNFCNIYYRYKTEGAEKYSDPILLLDANAEENSVTTEPLMNATLSKSNTYFVQIVAIDTATPDQETPVTIVVPSEEVYMHKPAGGKGMGLGGYCEGKDLLDVHWNQRVRKNLNVDGTISTGGKKLVDLIYPVGSIYMSVSDADPALLFGGTWERLKDRFLIGAGGAYEINKPGGASTVKLEVQHMPSHTHKPSSGTSPDPAKPDYMFQIMTELNSEYTQRAKIAAGNDYYANVATTHNFENLGGVKNTAATGGGEAHDNMPPYLPVYMYKRTA